MLSYKLARPLYLALAAVADARVARALAASACLLLVAALSLPPDQGASLPPRRPAEAGLRGPPLRAACPPLLVNPSPAAPLAALPRQPTGAGALCLVAVDEAAWPAAVGALTALAAPPAPGAPPRPAGGALVATTTTTTTTTTTPCPLAPDHTLLLATTGAVPPTGACTAHPDSGDLLAWGRAAAVSGRRPGVAAGLACAPGRTSPAPALVLSSRDATALCEAAVSAGAGLAQLGVFTHRGGAAGGGGSTGTLRTASFAAGLASAAISLRLARPRPSLLVSLAAAAAGVAIAHATLDHPPNVLVTIAACAAAALFIHPSTSLLFG